MKTIVFLFAILCNLSLVAQTEDISGTYELKLEASNALIIDTLILNNDGTFVFHEYDKHDGGVPPERNKYGRGHWKLEENIVTFKVETSDIDEKHTLNFNNSKARFITKSPRDKSDRIVPTSLKFFKSDVFWIVKRNYVKM